MSQNIALKIHFLIIRKTLSLFDSSKIKTVELRMESIKINRLEDPSYLSSCRADKTYSRHLQVGKGF